MCGGTDTDGNVCGVSMMFSGRDMVDVPQRDAVSVCHQLPLEFVSRTYIYIYSTMLTFLNVLRAQVLRR